ncbi:MAG: TlpA family protein disulfide reductase [Nitrospinota bacterium]
MNNQIKLVLYVCGLLVLVSVLLKFATGNISVNRKIPNLYAPQYKETANPARLEKVMPGDRDYIIKNYIMIKSTRARKINEFRLETLEGEPIDSTQFTGKVTMLYVMGVFNDTSILELPKLEELVAKYNKDEFRAYGIVVRSLPSEFEVFSKKHPVPFPVAIVEKKNPIPISFIPTNIFIDKQGLVRAYISGREMDEEVREFIIERLLKE